MRARLVTLTTDVGASYAAQMKGVLARSLPPGCVVDLVLDLRPHAIDEAAFLLGHMGATFPAGTVHLAVVDPGVGGARAPIAVACRDGSFLVGPDNGLLGPLSHRLGVRRTVRLDPHRISPNHPVSATFEGRDLFAPAAVLLALGHPLSSLGPTTTLSYEAPPAVRATPTSVRGRIVHADRFGNLITDIPPELTDAFRGPLKVRFPLGRPQSLPRLRTYSDGRPGAGMVLVSSFGTLEVSVREGSAARRYRAKAGDALSIGRAR